MIYSEECVSKLISLRKEKNLSQEQIGKIIKLSKQAVNEIEKGRAKVSLDNACLLADFYGVSLNYLVGKSEKSDQFRLMESTSEYSSDTNGISEGNTENKLSNEEKLILDIFRNLDDISKGRLIERSRILLEESPKYKTGKKKA